MVVLVVMAVVVVMVTIVMYRLILHLYVHCTMLALAGMRRVALSECLRLHWLTCKSSTKR